MQAILPRQRFQLLRRRKARAAEVFAADFTVGEVELGETDAAHAAAFNQLRLEVFADHQFGRAAADVDHQLASFLRLRMFDAHKNQARLFMTGNDLDRVGDNLRRALQKLFRVYRLAQGMGADNGDVARAETLQTFGEQRQAAQPALHRLFAQAIFAVQTVSQMYALLQTTKHLHSAVDHARDDHMKAV